MNAPIAIYSKEILQRTTNKMGLFGCGSSDPEAIQDRRIQAELKKQKTREKNNVKLLLLGTGESGKSTILKQMRILHLKGFTRDERRRYKGIVHSNALDSIYTLVKGAESLNLQYNSDDRLQMARKIDRACQEYATSDEKYPEPSKLFYSLLPDIKALWSDPAIRKAYENRSKLQLLDSAEYFLNALDRIGSSSYDPTDDDILRTRFRTTGIQEMEFHAKDQKVKMVDVGGQRNERRKWVHCFDNVSAIMFVISLSEYDQVLVEDGRTNRMKEALLLFEEIITCRFFHKTPIIILFNKSDLFEEKIKRVDLNVCFPDYKKGKNAKDALQFIMKKFMDTDTTKNRSFFTHVTNATDTKLIQQVFNASRTMLLNKRLTEVGLVSP